MTPEYIVKYNQVMWNLNKIIQCSKAREDYIPDPYDQFYAELYSFCYLR